MTTPYLEFFAVLRGGIPWNLEWSKGVVRLCAKEVFGQPPQYTSTLPGLTFMLRFQGPWDKPVGSVVRRVRKDRKHNCVDSDIKFDYDLWKDLSPEDLLQMLAGEFELHLPRMVGMLCEIVPEVDRDATLALVEEFLKRCREAKAPPPPEGYEGFMTLDLSEDGA